MFLDEFEDEYKIIIFVSSDVNLKLFNNRNNLFKLV